MSGPTSKDSSCWAQRLVTLAVVANDNAIAYESPDATPSAPMDSTPTASLMASAPAAMVSPSSSSDVAACQALADLAAAATAEAAAPNLRLEAISTLCASLGRAEEDCAALQSAGQGLSARTQPVFPASNADKVTVETPPIVELPQRASRRTRRPSFKMLAMKENVEPLKVKSPDLKVSGVEKRRSRKGTPRKSLPPGWLCQLSLPAQTALHRRHSAPARQEPCCAAAPSGLAAKVQHAPAQRAAGIAKRAQVLAPHTDRAATGAAQCPPPSPQPRRRLLASKLLSGSDATKGRVVMPAADVAAHFPAWRRQPARGSHEVNIADHNGQTYRVVFATWQNGQFALQRARPLLKALGAHEGAVLRLFDDGVGGLVASVAGLQVASATDCTGAAAATSSRQTAGPAGEAPLKQTGPAHEGERRSRKRTRDDAELATDSLPAASCDGEHGDGLDDGRLIRRRSKRESKRTKRALDSAELEQQLQNAGVDSHHAPARSCPSSRNCSLASAACCPPAPASASDSAEAIPMDCGPGNVCGLDGVFGDGQRPVGPERGDGAGVLHPESRLPTSACKAAQRHRTGKENAGKMSPQQRSVASRQPLAARQGQL